MPPMKQEQNFSGFLSSYSETTRKWCAVLCMTCAALALFFAWSAKITASFPVLGAGEDANAEQRIEEISQAAGIPAGGFTHGLAESIKDVVGVLKDSIFSANKLTATGLGTTSASEPESLHELFDKVSNESSAGGESTTSISSDVSTVPAPGAEDQSTLVQQDNAPPSDEPLPPIEDLPVP